VRTLFELNVETRWLTSLLLPLHFRVPSVPDGHGVLTTVNNRPNFVFLSHFEIHLKLILNLPGGYPALDLFSSPIFSLSTRVELSFMDELLR